MMRTIRIVIADDHEVTRMGIRSLLEKFSEIHILAEAKNGEEALQLVDQLKPDVLILDLIMPGLKPYQIFQEVRKNHPETEILILTAHDRARYLSEAIDAGVSGWIRKEEAAKQLVQAIYNAVQGKTTFDVEDFKRANKWRTEVGAKVDQLTRQQRRVIELILQGLDNKAIAQKLSVSPKTVETHITTILHTLGLASRSEIIVWINKNLSDVDFE